jgi:PTH2 family peptidyl-tRNA hydrolase
MSTKMVCVVRKDLKMRRGKEIAQGGHAWMAWLAERIAGGGAPALSTAEWDWLESSYRKITLQVSSETDLLAVH